MVRSFSYVQLLVLLIISSIYVTPVYAQRPVPASKQEKAVLLLNGIAHLGNGQVIENSVIGFKAGKLTLVGKATDNIDKSGYDEVITISGKHIYPGFILPNSTIGLIEVEAVRSTRDAQETGGLNPNVRSLIAYNTDSKVIPTTRFNGVLLAQITPRGGLISGTSAIVMLDGWNWEDAVLKADDGVHVNWPGMFRRTGWWAEPGVIEKSKNYDKETDLLAKFFMDARAYNQSAKKEEANLRFEALKGIFNGKQKLFIHAEFVKEISDAVFFAQKMGIPNLIIVGGADAWQLTDLLKQHNVSVMVGRLHDLPEDPEDDVDQPYKLPYLLQKAGILFCLNNEGAMEEMRSRNLPFLAGTAAAYGLSKEEALMSITGNTAKILGIDKQVGTLEVDKDATLFISTGDALDMRTNNVEQAFIQGRTIDLRNEQKELYERYKKKYELK